MAREAKVAECVAHYRGLLDSRPQPPESLSQHPMVTPGHSTGRSEGRSERCWLNSTMPLEGRNHDLPPAHGPRPRYCRTGCISLDAANPIKDLAPMRQLFRDEKTLQEFIWKHHDWFPDLRKIGLHQFRGTSQVG